MLLFQERPATTKDSRRRRRRHPPPPTDQNSTSSEIQTIDAGSRSTAARHSSESEGETNGQLVEPLPADLGPPPDPSSHPNFHRLVDMIINDLDRFVYMPAPIGFGDIQCRIVRDKRGVEKGLFPEYYMHVEKPNDSRKVRHSDIVRASRTTRSLRCSI